MSCNVTIADKKIPKAGSKAKLKKVGNTQDIINIILEEDKRAHKYTNDFAPSLRGTNIYNTSRNIYHFVRCNIKYRLDPFGKQFIKTPAQTWQDRYADCKSMSLFVGSILKNLGIPYIYRFVGYGQEKDVRHVYVVVPHKNQEIVIDACAPSFNSEKKYNKQSKKDYKMSKIYVVQGPEQRGRFRMHRPYNELSEAEWDLLIQKQKLEIDQDLAEKVSGIGSNKATEIEHELAVVNQMLNVVSNDNLSKAQKIEQIQHIGDIACSNIAGIGLFKKLRKKISNTVKSVAKKVSTTVKTTAKNLGSAAKSTVQAIKKNPLKIFTAPVAFGVKAAVITTKGATKLAVDTTKGATQVAFDTTKAAITAPLQLMAKAILEVQLPAAAPMFLYLFINDPATIEKLPTKAREKRKKSERLANFIVNEVGMKREHFMGIVRNGIKKRYGKEPEAVIADKLKMPIVTVASDGKKKVTDSKGVTFELDIRSGKIYITKPGAPQIQSGSGADLFLTNGYAIITNSDKTSTYHYNGEKWAWGQPPTISGIGVAAIVTAIISAVVAIINLIAKNKKKKHADKLTAEDVPDPDSDFGAANVITSATSLVKSITPTGKPSNPSPVMRTTVTTKEDLAKSIIENSPLAIEDTPEGTPEGNNNKTLLIVGAAGAIGLGLVLMKGKKRK